MLKTFIIICDFIVAITGIILTAAAIFVPTFNDWIFLVAIIGYLTGVGFGAAVHNFLTYVMELE